MPLNQKQTPGGDVSPLVRIGAVHRGAKVTMASEGTIHGGQARPDMMDHFDVDFYIT